MMSDSSHANVIRRKVREGTTFLRFGGQIIRKCHRAREGEGTTSLHATLDSIRSGFDCNLTAKSTGKFWINSLWNFPPGPHSLTRKAVIPGLLGCVISGKCLDRNGGGQECFCRPPSLPHSPPPKVPIFPPSANQINSSDVCPTSTGHPEKVCIFC